MDLNKALAISLFVLLCCSAGTAYAQGCSDVCEALEPLGFKLAARLIAGTELFGAQGIPPGLTIFLPNDAAVEAALKEYKVPLPSSVIEAAVMHRLDSNIAGRLSAALLRHVYPAEVATAEQLLVKGTLLTALGKGDSLKVTKGLDAPDGNITLRISAGEQEAVASESFEVCGGRVYATDKFLMPAATFVEVPLVSSESAARCLSSPTGCDAFAHQTGGALTNAVTSASARTTAEAVEHLQSAQQAEIDRKDAERAAEEEAAAAAHNAQSVQQTVAAHQVVQQEPAAVAQQQVVEAEQVVQAEQAALAEQQGQHVEIAAAGALPGDSFFTPMRLLGGAMIGAGLYFTFRRSGAQQQQRLLPTRRSAGRSQSPLPRH